MLRHSAQSGYTERMRDIARRAGETQILKDGWARERSYVKAGMGVKKDNAKVGRG